MGSSVIVFEYSFLALVGYPVLPKENKGQKASCKIAPLSTSNDFIVGN